MLGGMGIAIQHEYVIICSKQTNPIYLHNYNIINMIRKAHEIINKYGNASKEACNEFIKWVTSNPSLSKGEKKYKLLDDHGRIFRGVAMGAPEQRNHEKFFQPIIHPKTGGKCYPPSNGWSRTPENIQNLIENDEIIFGQDESVQPQKKVFLTEYYHRQMPSLIKDGHKGKNDVLSLNIEFPYCHPVSLYEDLIGAVTHEKNTIVLDHFAGSGTSGHAVIKLNRQDGNNRKYILVEMDEYFDTILKPRIKRVTYSSHWKNGAPQNQDNYQTIIKVQTLEQYEDLLDNLRTKWDEANLPEQVPVQYLYMPEQNSLSSSLDLSRPFGQTMRIGKTQETKTIDLMETWCYLQGYCIKSRRMFRGFDRNYLAVETTSHILILFRDIDTAQDDTENIKSICTSYNNEANPFRISRLEVNYDVDIRKIDLPVYIITGEDFLRGM